MKKVVVFAGHDHDTWEKLGAKGIKTDLEKDGVYEEFDTNFIIAKGTVERLRKAKGLTVLFPQENGRKMTLKQRVDYANDNDVNLIVDIHSNASASRTATGAAAFYWHDSEAGKKLAGYYASLLKMHGFPTWQGGTYASNLKDGWSGFYMLRYSKMPAILTENFFFTTRGELDKYLLNPKNQEKLMKVHLDMVTQYFSLKVEKPQVVKKIPKPLKAVKNPLTSNMPIYRVSVDGKQVNAHSQLSNIISEVEKAVEAEKKSISVVKI
ncbi:N-acetylmuramoyl-L-alanine amidase [Planococcus sp. N028]|uniref:N-acetylmuramoyl-L-alanine amidase n=1 Tax=Planococcus shixiaomingii TaxID=3058393 RepID=A0ABT8MZX2_9BACL|nr:N-acetylmuramoyl-L-alanine amidase [Planococcus sp. N028]MDN7241197.1 N-acetylmuramoyl-L-alanine amidase [Planococcus sp. N028]